MKESELMKFDWVMFDKENYEPYEISRIYMQVDHFNCGAVYGTYIASCEEDSMYSSREYGKVMPIPLTPEILEKNGFVTDNNHTLTGSCIYHRLCGKYEDYKVTVRLLNGWVKIESFDDRWYTLLDLSIQPRYVHELQRALRCCGLNDLADNFKIN